MSALCAFPPLIPAGGGVYSAGYMADVSRGNSYSAYTAAAAAATSRAAYGSTFFQAAVATKSVTRTPTESAWSSRSEQPAAKRRCTDKVRTTTTTTTYDQPIWPATPASNQICPSGCTMCQQQQFYDSRRPLQEKHPNREETKKRNLSVDPKKDYSTPLHVDCSVEYDLPRIVRPPPGAQPLLILAPPRPAVATPTTSYPSSTYSRPLPPQWNQQQQPRIVKSDKPASVKSHPTLSGIRSSAAVPCGCPSCCMAPYAPSNGQWMNQQHWSPPAGATASSAGFSYAPQQQQFQQQTFIDQQQQINRRRKRESDDKIQRLYSTTPQWNPTIQAAAEAAFIARYVSPAAWIAQPLKFHC